MLTDIVMVVLLLMVLSIIFINGRDIKRMLSDAKYERMDLHRRLESMARRLDALEQQDASEDA